MLRSIPLARHDWITEGLISNARLVQSQAILESALGILPDDSFHGCPKPNSAIAPQTSKLQHSSFQLLELGIAPHTPKTVYVQTSYSGELDYSKNDQYALGSRNDAAHAGCPWDPGACFEPWHSTALWVWHPSHLAGAIAGSVDGPIAPQPSRRRNNPALLLDG